ncbi:MAG TPA: hypothetical protein VFI31_00800 [Pirellulales bacterium]|nr:hypothetical protein [Pirellulales bacterium]
MLRTPRQVQLARIAIHRSRGERDVARRLYAELKRHDDEGDWPNFDDCPNEMRSLADLGLSLFACRRLERLGVRYAGELARFSKAELRAHVHIGSWRMLKKIRVALARANLELREPLPDEPPPRRPPLARHLERRHRRHVRRRSRRLSERRKRQIMYLVSKNVSEREISRRLGYRSHSTVYAVKREMRGRMTKDEPPAKAGAKA